MIRPAMTPWLLCAAVAAFLTVSSCSREGTAGRTTAPESAPAAETHAEEADALHLSDDMMRDLRLTTAAVSERTGLQEITALGAVAVDEDRYAEVAPSLAGQIVTLTVAVNAAVERGAPMARLRSVELGRARAALAAALARHELAAQTHDRRQTLAAERIVPQREVQEAAAALAGAAAEVSAARAELQALGITDQAVAADAADASVFTVRAPMAGRVLERRGALGAWAEPSAALFTLADLSRVWVVAQVFERDAVSVRAGTTAHVTLAALPGQEFDGRVALVGRQVDPGSRTVPVRVELANPAGVLRPGMSANVRVEIAGQETRILSVPAAALQRVGDRWLVFVPNGAAEFEMRSVGRGRDLGQDVEVVSGVKAGEMVVVDGAFLLKAEAEKKAGGVDEHGH